MSKVESGRSPSGRAGRASPEPVSADGLGHSATIPNADALEFQSLLQDAEREMEAEFNRVAGTVGWKVMDTPKLAAPFWDQLIDILGPENVRLMAGSSGNFRFVAGKRNPEPCEQWQRGTLLVSPEGMERGRRHAQAIEART